MAEMNFPGLSDEYDADYVGEMISDMRKHGYHFDELSSYDGYLCFRTETGALPTSFKTWGEVDNWLESIGR